AGRRQHVRAHRPQLELARGDPAVGVSEARLPRFHQEYPRVERTSLASAFRGRGYRTAFLTPSDLSWAGWNAFLHTRGFDEVRDYQALRCSEEVSSWGVEDRCMVDALVEFVGREPGRPFFAMGWTQQTHHPYEPSPGVPLLDLV